MAKLQPFLIAGSDAGLETDKKSFLLPEKAFPTLENAYVWRDRVKKREGLKFIGRLRRVIATATSSVNTTASATIDFNNVLSFFDTATPGVSGRISAITQANPGSVTTTTNHNLTTGDVVTMENIAGMIELEGNSYTITVTTPTTFTIGVDTTAFTPFAGGGNWTTEPTSEIVPGSLVITVGAPDTSTFTDQGDGTFAVTGLGQQAGSYINYITGQAFLTFTGVLTGGATVTAAFNYYPTLPAMGIIMRERADINFEQTLAWDTKYCYAFDGANYNEYLPATATTWNGSNSQFFWGANFRGSDASVRQLFVTNFNRDATGNPMRYTNGTTWTDFEPSIASTQVNNQALPNNPAGVTPYATIIAVPGGNPITPGTVTITMSNVAGTPAPRDSDTIWTDPNRDGTLKGSPNTSSGTINYATGAINLVVNPVMAAGACTVTVNYKYNSSTLYSARILIPYYGRLLAFNTFEGATRAGSTQYFNRLRFSQVGDPTQSGAWDSTIFGRGGFIDAPTNEEIISAIFYKNVMIVFFEKTTWQLRYVGDYGLPFAWERISSDLGSESQFANILFDDGVLGVGDRAIIAANSQGTERIDLKIPDIVFALRNDNQGTARVHGIREFQKELVFWCYNDSTDSKTNQIFPNKTLLYNYRNDTWAIFRNNVTVFGRYYGINSITWDRTDITWDDYEVTWNDPDGQAEFPFVICGNQQGFIHFYGYHSRDDRSLSITAVDRTVVSPNPLRLTIPNHNLQDGDLIYLENLDFIDTTTSADVTTDLNDKLYFVRTLVPYNQNIIEILQWDSTENDFITDYSYTPASGTGTYIGQGTATLLPRMRIVTKDFNPFSMEGKQTKIGYVDFLTDRSTSGQITVNIYADTATKENANLEIGQSDLPMQDNSLFNNPNSSIVWNRFYSTVFGSFISIEITYDDELMSDRDISDEPFELNALILWLKQGGRIA